MCGIIIIIIILENILFFSPGALGNRRDAAFNI
jgi:hypothetical protein